MLIRRNDKNNTIAKVVFVYLFNATFKVYTLGIACDDLFVCVFPFRAICKNSLKKKIETCERVDCRVEGRGCFFGIISFDTAGFKRGHRLRYITNSKSKRECRTTSYQNLHTTHILRKL